MVHRKADCINACRSLDNKIGIAKIRAAGVIAGFEKDTQKH